MHTDRAAGKAIRCLWLTITDPDPRINGQLIYSGGLIDSIAASGVEVEVLCLSRIESRRVNGMREGRVRWWLAEDTPPSRLASLASPLPHMARRTKTRTMRSMLKELLDGDGWDVIVLDGLSLGWVLQSVTRHYRGSANRPKLIYISHNHEESTRSQIAQHQHRFMLRQVMRIDAAKTAVLERMVVNQVDLTTAITPEDMSRYAERHPAKRIDVLSPGYRGRRIAARRITNDLPRRAIIVGSFDWVAKRMNLEEFVRIADPILAAAGVELQVVGSGDRLFLDRLWRKTMATTFTGSVHSVVDYLDGARLAIVPERSGGGFKLKVLDYVFNRLPILALDGSVAGVPLRQEQSILLYENFEALARGVIVAVDDIPLLNRLQETAYATCSSQFDWQVRGQQLLQAMAAA